MPKTKLFVVNLNFEGGVHGEIIEAEPALVADWVDARYISPVDERFDRIVEGADAPRQVTQSDVDAAQQ